MSDEQLEPAETISRTRPARAVRRVAHTRGTKKVTRYTLDLDGQQHLFLRMFALQNEVEASKVMRTMLYFLETDHDLANRVLDEIFGAEEAAQEAKDKAAAGIVTGQDDSADDNDADDDVDADDMVSAPTLTAVN